MPTKPKGRKTPSVRSPANASGAPGKSPVGEVIFDRSPDGVVRLEVQLAQDNVWLTQKQIAALFQRERSVITKHIRNVFKEGELAEKSNVQNLHRFNPRVGGPTAGRSAKRRRDRRPNLVRPKYMEELEEREALRDIEGEMEPVGELEN